MKSKPSLNTHAPHSEHSNTPLQIAQIALNGELDIALDNDGHLCDHSQWTEVVAQQLADTLSVQLTPLHMSVLQQVRAFFQLYKHPPATRPLIKHLQQTLPDDNISNQRLQQLFNTGLVARHVNRIAGLPKPPNCL